MSSRQTRSQARSSASEDSPSSQETAATSSTRSRQATKARKIKGDPREREQPPPTPPPRPITPPAEDVKPRFPKMSTIGQLKPFDSTVDSFEHWLITFKSFLIANELSEIQHATKCHAIFLTSVGIQNCALLCDLLAPKELKDVSLTELTEQLSSHFKPAPKALAERFKFNCRKQQTGETATQFLASLRALARFCKFTDLDTALRDQFVYGLANDRAQRAIFGQEDTVKLADVFKTATAMEAADTSTAIVRGGHQTQQDSEIHKASKTKQRPPKTHHSSPAPHHRNQGQQRPPQHKSNPDGPKSSKPKQGGKQHHRQSSNKSNICLGCGSHDHPRSQCPHKDSQCYSCKRNGHISKMCMSSGNFQRPQVKTVKIRKAATLSKDIFAVQVAINGVPHTMELDTGAETSMLSAQFWRQHLSSTKLVPSKERYKNYDDTPFPTLGDLYSTVEFNGRRVQIMLPVSKYTSLFGRDLIRALNLDGSDISALMKSIRNVSTTNTKDDNDMINEFRDVFTPPTAKDRIQGFKAKVILKDDAQPRFLKARPLPYAVRAKVDKELDEMEKIGILEKIQTSEWASPIVVVPKPDGRVRITADFKETVNSQLHVTQYPLASIDDIFANMNGGTVFSTLDGSNAYHQMELDERSKEFLVINTHRGLYRYHVLPQGIASSPAIFQEFMDRMLDGIPGANAYIDDTIMKGRDNCDHHSTFRAVLTRMREYNFKLTRKKCFIAKAEVKFVGHRISSKGIATTQEKVESVLNMKTPENVTDIKSFMGLVNFYGKFVPDLATIAEPIYHLTKDDVEWKWTSHCQRALEQIKRRVVTSPILATFDPALPIGIACDASSVGLGVVLFHKYQDGSERPIGFASKTLDDTERRYSQIEKEGYAIIFGIRKFYKYLCGRNFILITDHKPLLKIFGPKNKLPTYAASRLHHWSYELQQFTYTVVYRKSSDHGNADALSRLPIKDTKFQANTLEKVIKQIRNESCEVLPVTSAKIRQYTVRDKTLARVINYVMNGWPSSSLPEEEKLSLNPFFTRRDELSIYDGVLMWGIRVIVPDKLQARILEELHTCHTGIVKMKAIARSHVWWPGIDGQIENICRTCTTCQIKQPDPPTSPLHPWQFPEQPWERLHMDLAGPFLGKMWLIVVDAHSKWPEVFPIPGTTTAIVTSKLDEIFSRFGLPLQIVSDNGRQFVSREFDAFCKRLNIKHVLSSVYHARSNGEAERFVRTFKEAMTPSDIPISGRLSTFLMKYRVTPHSTTGVAPAELLLGKKFRTLLDLTRPNVRASVAHSQQRQASSYNKRAKWRDFAPGQTVWVKSFARNSDKWTLGTIKAALGPVTMLVDIGGQQLKRHVDHLREARTSPRNKEHHASSISDSSSSGPTSESSFPQAKAAD